VSRSSPFRNFFFFLTVCLIWAILFVFSGVLYPCLPGRPPPRIWLLQYSISWAAVRTPPARHARRGDEMLGENPARSTIGADKAPVRLPVLGCASADCNDSRQPFAQPHEDGRRLVGKYWTGRGFLVTGIGCARARPTVQIPPGPSAPHGKKPDNDSNWASRFPVQDGRRASAKRRAVTRDLAEVPHPQFNRQAVTPTTDMREVSRRLGAPAGRDSTNLKRIGPMKACEIPGIRHHTALHPASAIECERVCAAAKPAYPRRPNRAPRAPERFRHEFRQRRSMVDAVPRQFRRWPQLRHQDGGWDSP